MDVKHFVQLLTLFNRFAFTNGNFSILINGFQDSDLGSYCCQLSHECQKLEIQQSKSGIEQLEDASWNFQWYYFIAASGGLILLMIALSLVYEYRGMCLKRFGNTFHVSSAQNRGPTSNPSGKKLRAEHGGNRERVVSDDNYETMEGVEQQEDYQNMEGQVQGGQSEDTDRDEGDYVNTESGQREIHYISPVGAEAGRHHSQTGHGSNVSVYENEEHDPHLVRISPQPHNKAIREEPTQSILKPSYYVNQSEFCKAESAGKRKKPRKRKKKSQTEYQFRNPIYADSSVVPKT
ncbi:uncharacterized protein [Hoplias malabaricus]|uniref:uncharacterized protein isoform X2 n=1 Tax=Hoplias malabaricus TaxID=27720 RepID=UPI003461DA93